MLRRSFLFLCALAIFANGPVVLADNHAGDDGDGGGVIVFGGNGRTGAMIVERLLAKGWEVTVFVRPTSDRSRLDGMDVKYAVGDAMNAADVEAAIAAARPQVVINAIGGRGTTAGFWDVTQMNMTASAKKHGAKELIFLSSVGVGDSAVAYSEEARARTKDSMDERARAEEDMKASGLDYLILRTGIIAPEGTAETGQGALTKDPTVLAPIARADLATITVNCIGNPDCLNQTFTTYDPSIKLGR